VRHELLFYLSINGLWVREMDGICPRCERPILSFESSAEMDGEIYHTPCAMEEMDEIGMDDDFGCNG